LSEAKLTFAFLSLLVVGSTGAAFSQTPAALPFGTSNHLAPPLLDVSTLSLPAAAQPESAWPSPQPEVSSEEGHHGAIARGTRRILHDQKSLYLAPFKPVNIKWDLLVLVPTGVLLAEDRHIERHLPGGNLNFYPNISNVALAATAGTLAATWIYGIKTDNPHAKELGTMELETLVDTFLIYTPMQFIAGRQRPGEGNGHGDFLRHHNINTSFPGGHAMFTWAMASVAAHEYPKTWVKVLAYSAAFAVTTGRFLGRDHWASDMLVGSTLGYFIGSHVFHTRCEPGLSDDCRGE
jgi:membrane-associated phospholipid phosphatase